MKVYCKQCRHYIPWGQRPGSTAYSYNSYEECASNPGETVTDGSPVYLPKRRTVNAVCREKNRDNDCAEFSPPKLGWWVQLFASRNPVSLEPRPRIGFNPPPVENVVKPPAPPLAPEPGRRCPRPDGAGELVIKPPPKPGDPNWLGEVVYLPPPPPASELPTPARFAELLAALRIIREAPYNLDSTAQWMQLWAAHAMEPHKWPKPMSVPPPPFPENKDR